MRTFRAKNGVGIIFYYIRENFTDMKKEKTPDLRPWYKKKRFIIPAIFIFLVLVGRMMDSETKNAPAENRTLEAEVLDDKKDKPVGFDLKVRINAEIAGIMADKDVLSVDDPDINDIKLGISTMEGSIELLKKAKADSDPEINKLSKELEPLIVEMQKVSFPKLRKGYFEFVKNTLWEHDINVKLEGKSNTKIIFTGAYFAANKNIKDTQSSLSEMLNKLRFKEAHYEWYKNQEDRNYYEMKTPSDGVIVLE